MALPERAYGGPKRCVASRRHRLGLLCCCRTARLVLPEVPDKLSVL